MVNNRLFILFYIMGIQVFFAFSGTGTGLAMLLVGPSANENAGPLFKT